LNLTKNQRTLLFYTFIFIMGCLLIPDIYVWGKNDRNCWFSWCNYIHHYGIQNIYKLHVDYPPLVHYFLWFIAKTQGSSEMIYAKIYKLKYLVLLIEMVSIYMVYNILELRKIKYSHLLPLLILFNIAFWYNNFFFGQVDGVYTAFAFISLAFAVFKKPSLSLMFFVLCVNFKFQGIIFFPIIFLTLFNTVKHYSLGKIALILLPSIVLQVVIFLPFILTGDIQLAFDSFSESMGRYPFINMGAYNIWSLIFEHPETMNDNNGILNFSFNTIGLLTFFGFSGIILLPFALKSSDLFDTKLKIEFTFENVFLATTLIVLVFFYFNTQMHARYSHPVILFAGTLAILRKDYVRFLLVSVAVFLNMEGASKILKGDIAEFKIFWFQPWFVSTIFLVVIFLYSYDYIKLLQSKLKESPKS
jgi:Gpi18-like mannosyltransferase